MNPYRPTRAFTLIELLVVIAIIGLLSSVVLASLNTARRKAVDAQTKSDLHMIMTEAIMYYEEHNNTYGAPNPPPNIYGCVQSGSNLMVNESIIKKAINQILTDAYGMYCANTGSSYLFMPQLLSDPNHYWCVDSTGTVKKESVVYSQTSGFYASLQNDRCI